MASHNSHKVENRVQFPGLLPMRKMNTKEEQIEEVFQTALLSEDGRRTFREATKRLPEWSDKLHLLPEQKDFDKFLLSENRKSSDCRNVDLVLYLSKEL